MGNFKYSISKLSLIVLTSLTVAACGSGGNGGNPSPGQPQQPQPQQPQPQPQPQPHNATGAALAVSVSDHGEQVIKNLAITDSNLTELNVDGQKINLTSELDKLVCCSDHSDSRFGVISGNNNTDYVFYNGNPTKEMPIIGTAEYLGGVVLLGASESVETGKALFKVNFENKTLTGTFNVPRFAITVDGQIKNNSFTGTATPKDSAVLPGIAKVEGKFYGDQAKEMGGLFTTDDGTWGGSFGAQKQN